MAKTLDGGWTAGREPTMSRSPVSTRTRRKLWWWGAMYFECQDTDMSHWHQEIVFKTDDPQQPNPKNPQQRRRNGQSQCCATLLYILLYILCCYMISRNQQTHFYMPIIIMFVFSLVMQDQSFWSTLILNSLVNWGAYEGTWLSWYL